MKLEAGQVTVVTGGASGIGRAMVDAFAARGLAVVLADVEQGALDAAVAEVAATGARAMGARIDVRRPEELEALAATVQAEFGRVDVLCNNAGVVTPRAPAWLQSHADWTWLVDVNLHGVANGIRAFVPAMVAAGRGHIVNTSSMAGLTTIPGGGNAAYSATKHAVVGLSETLRLDLSLVAPDIGVTVLCPGPVASRIHDAARNRPADLAAPEPAESLAPGAQSWMTLTRVSAEEVGAQVVTAVEEGLEYVVTHPDVLPLARGRAEHLLEELSDAVPGGTDPR
ncbi:SDR family NAD(P)-dependent oxidoreductase [Blastococcus sp. PRF04-17]|uniref:SDR family NAD(P)-dependent oxidoreductase n=1 Tax=Blastococcus sp. PRF04-17 TaxID=2933797 RepID=UPI001FF372D2|nr:SDR family NAD(P)-dependent oxidoreductase [Blastococcus sp. PRF04-17]UOY01814.1 SDR family NAD(P)-dependent oxidoreductase [Blastococcus sp. PRF04-17]